jgi:hypothetical protein
MGRQKDSISMLSLQRMLEIKTCKTAWAMGHEVRQAMAEWDAGYKLVGLIEMDDTYFRAPKPGKRGRGAAGKAKVVVVVALETPADKPRFAAFSGTKGIIAKIIYSTLIYLSILSMKPGFGFPMIRLP